MKAFSLLKRSASPKKARNLARTIAWTALAALLAGCVVVMWSGLHDDLAPADVALVLGSAVKPDGEPSLSLRARLDEAVDLYHQGYFKLALVSGGVGKTGYDEATVMKAYLAAHGVPAASIIEDHQGDNTYASALHTVTLLKERGLKSVLVISQYFHLPRARLALHRFGVSNVRTAHAHLFEPRDFYSVPREALAWVIYALRPYPPLPAPSISSP